MYNNNMTSDVTADVCGGKSKLGPNCTETTEASAILSARDQLMLDIEHFLKVYYSMFLILMGTIFNILSILVLSRAAFRRTTTSVYLRYLACVDMFVLYNGISRHFVSGITDYNIRNLSESFCKFNQWSSSFAPDISAWILVAVTTERVISIVWPHKVKIFCSKLTAKVTITIISLVIMAANLPLLVFFGNKQSLDPSTNQTVTERCVYLQDDYKTFMDNVWYWLDLVKFVILPATFLIISNIIIIIFVVRSRRRVEKGVAGKGRGNDKTGNISAVTGSVVSMASTSQVTSSSNLSDSSSRQTIANSRVSGANREISLTITLVVVNATFVICNTPIMVYLLGAPYWFPPGFGPAERLTVTAAVMAMYTNNAANFLLYCATGSRFRAEIRHLFGHLLRCKPTCMKASTNADADEQSHSVSRTNAPYIQSSSPRNSHFSQMNKPN